MASNLAEASVPALMDTADANVWETVFQEYFQERKTNTDAIADLALENFEEVRRFAFSRVFIFVFFVNEVSSCRLNLKSESITFSLQLAYLLCTDARSRVRQKVPAPEESGEPHRECHSGEVPVRLCDGVLRRRRQRVLPQRPHAQQSAGEISSFKYCCVGLRGDSGIVSHF